MISMKKGIVENKTIIILLLSISIIFLLMLEYINIKRPEPQLFWNGEPFRPVGFNYYPCWHPWTGMWEKWNASEIRRDFQIIKSLGGNCIRTFVQWSLIEPELYNYNTTLIAQLQEFFSIAEDENIAIILTFFDLDPPSWAGVDSKEEVYINSTIIEYQIDQLEYLIPLLNISKAAFMWDLVNEPQSSNLTAKQLRNWAEKLATAIRNLNDTHYITIGGGWGNFEDPTEYADVLDVVSMHYYCCRDKPYVKSHFEAYIKLFKATSKPVILEEFGWPTNDKISEEMQANYYSWILDECDRHGIAGVLPWALWDFPTATWEISESAYGVLRADGTWKPSAYVFKEWAQGTKQPYINYEIGGFW
ncbi:MAG: glycoside hydrolase 5 family protein [Promethearchaeota archaeon]